MKRLMLLLGCLCIPAVAQQDSGKNPVLLDAAHPSVYLQYDHEAERKPEHPGEGSEGLWLRIHNNTRGAISVRTQSLYIGSKVAPLALISGKHVLGIRDGIEIAPLFSVEEDHETGFDRLPLTFVGDVSAISWIPSGGTVLMSLPKDDLVKGRRVALPFSYEWESGGDAIEHEAFFYAREVPPQTGAVSVPSANTSAAGLPILQEAALPVYPPIGRAARITGKVVVEVTVSGGKVTATDVKSGPRLLFGGTVANLQTWRFASDVNGKFTVTYTYVMSDEETESPTNPTVEMLPSLDVKITAHPVKPIPMYSAQGIPATDTAVHEAGHVVAAVQP